MAKAVLSGRSVRESLDEDQAAVEVAVTVAEISRKLARPTTPEHAPSMGTPP